MNETCQKAEDFLNEIIDDLQFDLDVEAEWTDEEGCLISLHGEDTHFLLSENGEMLGIIGPSGSAIKPTVK